MIRISPSTRRPAQWLTLAIIAAVFLAGLILRPPPLWDFAVEYASAKAWAQGSRPFEPDDVDRIWKETRPPAFLPQTTKPNLPLFPPGTLTLISPLTLLSSQSAALLWLGLSLLLTAASWLALVRISGWDYGRIESLALAGTMLLFAPLQLGFRAGQPAIPAVALILIAISLAGQETAWPGLLLGLAATLKPQLAAPVILYYLWRRPRIVVWSVVVPVAITVAGILRLQLAGGSTWLADYLQVLRLPPQDFTGANPNRDHLLNLQVGIYALTHSRLIAVAGATAVAGMFLVVYITRLERHGEEREELLKLSALCTLFILPVYHRFYDAAMLVLPLAWALGNLRGHSGGWARRVLMLILVFLLPLGTPFVLVEALKLPAQMAARVEELVAVPFWSWVMLAICICLLAASKARPQMDADEHR
jgi:hypothetical protein